MSCLYKRSNRFWHLLIKHDLVHTVGSPLVELTRARHVHFRARLLRSDETIIDGWFDRARGSLAPISVIAALRCFKGCRFGDQSMNTGTRCHRRRCASTLRSNTGDGLIIGRRSLIARSASTRLRHPHRRSHAAAIIGERFTPPAQWINSFPCRTDCAIAVMTASNCRAEIGLDSATTMRV